jgi:hypothetical protein
MPEDERDKGELVAEQSAALTAERDVDGVVVGLRQLCRSAAVDLSFQIGKLIIDLLFDGSVERWKSEGTRQVHYRELAKHPDLPLSASALCRSVGIYALCHDLGGHQQWQHIGTGHVQELLTLELPDQARLLEAAEQERWTVMRLRTEVAKLKPQGEGRRRPQRFARTLKDVKSYLVRQHEALRGGEPETLSEETALDLRETIAKLQALCELLTGTLNEYDQRRRRTADPASETRIAVATPSARSRSSR